MILTGTLASARERLSILPSGGHRFNRLFVISDGYTNLVGYGLPLLSFGELSVVVS